MGIRAVFFFLGLELVIAVMMIRIPFNFHACTCTKLANCSSAKGLQ